MHKNTPLLVKKTPQFYTYEFIHIQITFLEKYTLNSLQCLPVSRRTTYFLLAFDFVLFDCILFWNVLLSFF